MIFDFCFVILNPQVAAEIIFPFHELIPLEFNYSEDILSLGVSNNPQVIRLDKDWKVKFIEILHETGIISDSCMDARSLLRMDSSRILFAKFLINESSSSFFLFFAIFSFIRSLALL